MTERNLHIGAAILSLLSIPAFLPTDTQSAVLMGCAAVVFALVARRNHLRGLRAT